MAWRLARSLETLRAELDAAVPNRKKPDGTIGDQEHASRASRHNPNIADVVCAVDVSTSAALDVHALCRKLAKQPHPNLEYMISNDEVASRTTGWVWRPYSPNNPRRNKHIAHAHFAVGRGPDSEPTQPYDDTTPWGIAALLGGDEDDMAQVDQAEWDELQTRVRLSHESLARVEAMVAAGKGVSAADIANAIPKDLAEQVAQELAERLAG